MSSQVMPGGLAEFFNRAAVLLNLNVCVKCWNSSVYEYRIYSLGTACENLRRFSCNSLSILHGINSSALCRTGWSIGSTVDLHLENA